MNYEFDFEYVPIDMDDMPEFGDCVVHVSYEEGDDHDMIGEGFWFTFTVGNTDCTDLLSKSDRKYLLKRIPLEHERNINLLEDCYAD